MTAIVHRETSALTLAAQAHQLLDFGSMLVSSGMLPSSVRTPEAAVTIIVKGMELGLPPMAALNGITVIQGKPTVSPQLMLSLINRSGQLENIELETGPQGATVTMKRRGRSPFTARFGPNEAQAMGLNSKDNYKKQAPVMYQWRAVAACARVVFPDVIDGMYTPEELGADVQVDEDGAMTVTVQQEAKVPPRRDQDVTREVQQAAGTPERTPEPDPALQTAVERVEAMAARVRKFGEREVQGILDASDWRTNLGAAAETYRALTAFGKQHASLAPAGTPPPQEDGRAVAIARRLGEAPYSFKANERTERLAFLGWLVSAGRLLLSSKDLSGDELDRALKSLGEQDGAELLERWNVSRQPAPAASTPPARPNRIGTEPVQDATFTELPGVPDDEDLPF